MRLQQSTLLGLYATLELAKADGEQRSAAAIADKFDVSINHLAKVLRIEDKEGLEPKYDFDPTFQDKEIESTKIIEDI